MDELFETEELYLDTEDFPTKAEFGTMLRKRRAMRKEYFKLKRAGYNSGYPWPVAYRSKDRKWCWTGDPDIAYTVRCYRGKRSKHIKTYCHRKFRRAKDFERDDCFWGAKTNHYRRCQEFWWELD